MASHAWELVGVARVELSLPLTLPTGQTFRWRKTGAEQFTGVVGRHLLSLKHEEGDPQGHVAFLAHGGAAEAAAAGSAIREYLNLDVAVSVAAMWQEFAAADVAFAELARRLDGGVRILKQDPVECLFQFLCSSNNNIGRIQRMVENLASLGECIGTVDGVDFYRFPELTCWPRSPRRTCGEPGLGTGRVRGERSKGIEREARGGVTWLESLREMELAECIEALCTLPGVGPKVAACVALFSLDHHHAIPVDTHVWQIATRDLIPELAGSRISPKHYGRISEAFVRRYGKYAGWAQAALFVGELPSQKKKEPRKRKQSTT